MTGTIDFFGHQDRARAATNKLVALFALAVLGIIGCIYGAAVGIFVVAEPGARAFQPEILLAVTGGVLAVVMLAMLFKTAQLRSGGPKVAELLGGRRVDPSTTDPHERVLHNVVEEMAIASGIPVPAVYVLDGESGLNAFAAGWTTRDAAVAVTRGLLEALDRDELQGVIAHEFSHVFHGDMRLNIRLMGVLFGIVCITTIGRILVRVLGRGGGSDKKGGAAAIALFGLALILIGWLGVLFARLIQAAVSRQREFLADSSAVQYTRNPRGIGLALAKIGGLTATMQSPHADEASHLFFADGVKRFLGGAFATHPPVTERVKRLLPGFDRALREHRSLLAAASAVAPPPGAMGLAENAAAAPGVTPQAFVASAGEVGDRHVAAARALLAEQPLELLAAARERARAPHLALALLLDRDAGARDAQLAHLGDRAAAVRDLAGQLRGADERTRLALLGAAIAALRQLPPDERDRLRSEARAMAHSDGVLSPFEFALLRTLERHVPRAAAPRAPQPRPIALAQCAEDARLVLSVLAHHGATDDAGAAAAFATGHAALQLAPSPTLLPRERCGIDALEACLDRLAAVSPLGKRNLLLACATTAGADGVIAPAEANLLRALAETWDCPIPLTA